MSLEQNKAAGKEFIDQKVTGGATLHQSGMAYTVLREGSGDAKPAPTDKVEVHYEGTLTDGTVFDSSYKRGQKISFGLNQVIAGWTIGVGLMTPGAVYELYIPSDLAYGDSGIPGVIPPGSTLVFKVELFRIL